MAAYRRRFGVSQPRPLERRPLRREVGKSKPPDRGTPRFFLEPTRVRHAGKLPAFDRFAITICDRGWIQRERDASKGFALLSRFDRTWAVSRRCECTRYANYLLPNAAIKNDRSSETPPATQSSMLPQVMHKNRRLAKPCPSRSNRLRLNLCFTSVHEGQARPPRMRAIGETRSYGSNVGLCGQRAIARHTSCQSSGSNWRSRRGHSAWEPAKVLLDAQ